jgi:hypothetical protein
MSRIREFEISELARIRESRCPHGQLVLETEKVCEANGLKFLLIHDNEIGFLNSQILDKR